MQLIVSIGDDKQIEIKCPVCDSLLESVFEPAWSLRRKQLVPSLQDERVRIMRHPAEDRCRWSSETFRVDRYSGYAEPWPEIEGKEAQDRANLPLTP